jgi:hypothetical protein
MRGRVTPLVALATIALMLGMAATARPALATNCCSLNNGPCNIFPLVHGTSPWTGNVCGSTISGTNCVAQLDADATASSGNCITLGAGVTLDLKGFAIHCTSGSCGTAVYNTTSGATSSKVMVEDGSITGCWTDGIFADLGTNSSATNMTIDLSGSGCQGTVGISGLKKSINTTVVKHASTCIDIIGANGVDITDSMVRDCSIGINSIGASTSTFTNVQSLHNDVNVKLFGTGSATHANAVSLQDAATCNCENGSGSCLGTITDCLTFTGATSFVDDTLLP